ncbi:hypothetical protein C9382_16200 [Pseudomonas aylmerensis]|uniref:Uncharacterized protein n=1 Tax=Pseudomonas aylmerensis TaxID=1869229 RepID=A0A2T4FWG4_9PSED|nr:hypothetical protein C9382_16200 [Pseudomonas aylmerensis]
MWELACLRKRWISQRMHQLTDRLREQARSHRGLGWGLRSRVYADQMWELACLRKRWVSQRMHQLTDRLRGQARSHRGFGLGLGSGCTQIKCGSWLACEGGGPATECIN